MKSEKETKKWLKERHRQLMGEPKKSTILFLGIVGYIVIQSILKGGKK